jgi:hypothetical protein
MTLSQLLALAREHGVVLTAPSHLESTSTDKLVSFAAALAGVPGNRRVVVDAYAIPMERGRSLMRIERARQASGRDLWKVVRDGECLSRQGEWEWEPMPSGRDEQFLSRCRFEDAQGAIEAALVAQEERNEG